MTIFTWLFLKCGKNGRLFVNLRENITTNMQLQIMQNYTEDKV